MISNNYANTLLSFAVGRKAILEAPDYVYLGLCSEEPTTTHGTVNGEPTGGGYTRKKVGGASEKAESFFGAPSGGIISNSKEIQMSTARKGWGTMYYWFLSESSDGDAIIWGDIYNKEGTKGLLIEDETVPVFYENELRASIGVELEPPKPDTE